MRKPFLGGLALAAGLFAILYLAFGQEHVVPLKPFEEPPRPPVQAEPAATHITLSGRRVRGEDRSNEARTERNALVARHAQALAECRAGRRPLRDVEAIEMDLHLARHRLREIDDTELHTLLATLFERELARLRLLEAEGLASRDHVERALLYVARERHFAGLPSDGEDYETMRKRYLTASKQRHDHLADLGLGSREHFEVEYQSLEAEFGPLEP